ncbi:nickel ABC transporter substrate-binding protein [Inquilinus limosus]|uniref:Nickel ABC transporter, nickel/metallophore periplasmic binding protein n=1 Tax=Inquilinus limosus TaxID=171674 RepID=A0A211ZVP7_9PROT|nr:nickel ABC transporter substrate-binding protein [Inquilinus limosus]OWJ69147.1 nickel ABC transporter, nickel/metallophore periplasmic binding protein [Inquilinus limosus]
MASFPPVGSGNPVLTRRAALAWGAAGIAAAGAFRLPGSAWAAESDGDSLTYSWPSNVGPLNPHLYNPNQMFAQSMLYEPLVRYGEGGRIEPCLAENWTLSDDGRVYTFHLRQGVRFTDGAAFDAAAVKANFDAVLKNRDRHSWLEIVAQIEAAEAADPATFRLHLRRPYYPALYELSLIRPLRFLSPKAIPADGDTSKGIAAPVGTGPWKLVETALGERDVFARNDDYWGPKPALSRITVLVIPDPTTRGLALETGDIDLAYGTDQLSPQDIRRLQADPRFTVAISPPMSSRLLAMNTTQGPTADLAVRRAVLHGVNRGSIVRNVLLGLEAPAETLFATNLPYTDLGLPPYAFDRDAAARLLDQAGWAAGPDGTRQRDGQELAIDYYFPGADALQKAIAEAVQADLRPVGIAIRLHGEESNSVGSRQRSGDFGMITSDSWGAPYDPHSFMSSMRVPSHADYQAQRGLAMKAEIDARIGQVLVSTDEEARRADYRWLLTTLHEQAVYLPVSYTTVTAVHPIGVAVDRFGFTENEIPFERITRAAG